MVPLFLPKSESESDAICKNLESSETLQNSKSAGNETLEEKFNALLLPFIIVSVWIALAGLGFIFLAFSKLELPSQNNNNEAKKSEEYEEIKEDKEKNENRTQIYLMIFLASLI